MVLFNHLKTTPSTSVERFLTGEGGRSAQKIPHIVYAKRVDSNVAVSTREGTVLAYTGDYLLFDSDGNQWPISEEHLRHHYDVVEQNVDGRYKLRAKCVEVRAIELTQAISIPIRADGSRLSGAPGDWLVRYLSGDFGIVAKHLFADSYRLLE